MAQHVNAVAAVTHTTDVVVAPAQPPIAKPHSLDLFLSAALKRDLKSGLSSAVGWQHLKTPQVIMLRVFLVIARQSLFKRRPSPHPTQQPPTH